MERTLQQLHLDYYRMNKVLYIVLGIVFVSQTAYGQFLKLWYEKPAARWEENLPLGNGQIGMMLNGGVQDEHIVLNEISMWSGSEVDANNYEAYKSVQEIQALILAGKNDLAEQLVNKNFVCAGAGSGHGSGANVPYGCYQNFGFLNFNHQIQGDIQHYNRNLDIQQAIAETTFSAEGVNYSRTYFTSMDDNVGVINLKASKKKAITFSLGFYRDENIQDCKMDGNNITIQGQLPDGSGGKGLKFAAKIRVIAKGGTQILYDNQIIIKNADEVRILISATTDYYGHDPLSYVQHKIDANSSTKFRNLAKKHKQHYAKVFDRVKLNIADLLPKDNLPTNERLSSFYQDASLDNGLAVLYYQFGRYLQIASTAPHVEKALPPNLQGLWAPEIQTPWNGDYHLNINAQMNHWGVEVNNLSEYHMPFIQLIKRLALEGEKTAKAYYNAPGWVSYMMTNIWGHTAPGEQASWGASTSSGWLCNHLWEHYLFTNDKNYLKDIYPILRSAAQFYQATLVKDPTTGWFVTSPSVSPENAFKLPNGHVTAVTMGPTIDNQIVRELYQALIASNEILGLADPFVDTIKYDLNSVPPPVIISDSGRVMEWIKDYEEVEPQHRHVSHLYGLYPANFISPITSPKWAAAAKRTLEVRGDEGTGWSRAWKILFWARLHDGNHTLDILRQLLRPAIGENGKVGAGTYPNLFCAHPPFQIDGNFGGAAGIAEMLVQSHDGFIHLLPALPDAWKEGEVKGLKARGNVTVDISWKNGVVKHYKLHGKKGQKAKVFLNKKFISKII